jgi:integrase
MSDDEINNCVESLQKQFGKDSYEVAAFVFYYLSGSRNESIYTAKTTTFEVNQNGWITGRVYEKKTKATWKKYIPDDNPHFEILERWIAKRKAERKIYLFSEDGTATVGFILQLRNAFKEIYKKIGLTEEYFFKHAIHCLRHVAAHYWLKRTGMNYVAVAKIVGWKDIQTLIQCYGEFTDEQIFNIAMIGAVA